VTGGFSCFDAPGPRRAGMVARPGGNGLPFGATGKLNGMIGAIILGLLAGFIGRALMPGKQDMNILATLLLGLAGSLIGFLIFTELLGIGDTEAFDLGGLIGAIIGTILLLFLYERFVHRDSGTRPAPRTR
jgi:uncharacterized membrane protein YeaQ/YmgE (transglycosylase-associated protein family)